MSEVVWTKGQNLALSPHFRSEEFQCRCTRKSCVTQRASQELLDKLEALRMELGASLYIRSGFRCAEHQESLRQAGYETAKGVSQHELGRAADIATRDMSKLAPLAHNYFKAVGVATTFIHVDLRDDKERHWTYS